MYYGPFLSVWASIKSESKPKLLVYRKLQLYFLNYSVLKQQMCDLNLWSLTLTYGSKLPQWLGTYFFLL